MISSPRFTTRDLDALPDIEGIRYEIIDGELYVSKATHWRHQYVGTRVSTTLDVWGRVTGDGVVIQGPGLVFADDENVIPDLVWIARDRLRHVWHEAGHMRAAPDLAIEVLAPGRENERRDRELKLDLYSRWGVREYTIVDWAGRRVEVYRRAEGRPEGRLELAATLGDGDVLTSSLLPGFACPLASIWPPTNTPPTAP
jgi:Uma2 family endonuclease